MHIYVTCGFDVHKHNITVYERFHIMYQYKQTRLLKFNNKVQQFGLI